ncbi:hypothetical protein l11_04630 [Neisseria weaveri LMG 5135]|nr:hypothetical protein l11_04630 [Neisseria weaveri LMG 5135]
MRPISNLLNGFKNHDSKGRLKIPPKTRFKRILPFRQANPRPHAETA